MKDADLARLFVALHGTDPGPDEHTRKKALRRLLFSEDGLTLIKHFSPCLRANVNALSSEAQAFMEGRRSVILELVATALRGNEE